MIDLSAVSREDLLQCNQNPYKLLAPRAKVDWRNEEYARLLFNTINSMFVYEKSDDYKHIEDTTIENILLLNGQIAFYEDKIIKCGYAFDGGIRDINNIGSTISINCLNGEGVKKDIKNCVLGFNNNTRTGEMTVVRYADQLSEVDLSEKNNIEYTRLYPIFIAKNQKIATAIKEFFKRVTIGDKISVTSTTGGLTDKEDLQTVNITDISAIDKLQYLSTYHNALLRRFYTIYGHALAEGMKVAQQSVAEISSATPASFVIPLNMLRQREKMCERLVEKFGGSISVQFSPAWQRQYETFMKSEVLANGEN